MQHELRVKRVYDEPSAEDGFRILVDRLRPRGVSKDAAQIDLWAKELTPSNELRKWFHEDSSRYDEFVAKYRDELEEQRDEINSMLSSLDEPILTLVTSTKDLGPSGNIVGECPIRGLLGLHQQRRVMPSPPPAIDHR